MPFDFTDLEAYLSGDVPPAEVVRVLRHAQYGMVQLFADQSNNQYIADCYFSLVQLEEEFLKLDESLHKICVKWK